MSFMQKISEYLDILIENQNMTNDEALKNLANEKDYLLILKPIIDIFEQNPNISYEEIQKILYSGSKIAELIKTLVHKKELTPGLVLDFGTANTRHMLAYGLKQEFEILNNCKVWNPQEISYNTIFDLASTSKIFTCIAILKLMEEKQLDLFSPVTNYVPEFQNLKDVTIFDLLKFNVHLETRVRVDTAKSKEEAERILFSTFVTPKQEIYNAYTDIGAMILRFVVERVSHLPFSEFIQTITQEIGMTDTYLNVPLEQLSRVASENFSTVIDAHGNPLINTDNIPGTVHDSKAIAMGHHDGIAPGHAGYFSTAHDMILLAQALINNTILKKETVNTITENIVGKKLANDDYSWYYGSLVYTKQPTLGKYSVYSKMSGKTFMSPGFAGTLLYVDPLNKISLFLGSNRLHNRIYKIHHEQTKNILVDNETGKKYFNYANGSSQVISTDFTLEREELVKKALDLALQYRFLDFLFIDEKEMSLTRFK